MLRWLVLLLLWVTTIILWMPRIFPKAEHFKILGILSLCVQIFASAFIFYSLYHLTALVFALIRRQPKSSIRIQGELDIPVGLIVTVCDDFQEPAAKTLLQQNYEHFHVYICDDSQSSETKEKVDGFHRNNRIRTTVIRRKDNSGFKAGNINHAFRTGLITEPLILLIDADERLERHFLRCIVAEFIDSQAPFLQASHRAVHSSATRFQQMLSPSVRVYWKVYEQARNTDGFPLVLGHGVLLPRLLIEELGGFDETTTSEDIEFSYKIAFSPKCGRGRVSCQTWAFEEVPLSLQHYRARFCRWLKQDLALGLRVFPKIFSRLGSLSVAERFDLLIKQFHIPVCGLALPYLFMLAILLLFSSTSVSQDEANFTHTEKVGVVAVGLTLSLAPILPVLLLAQKGSLRRICCAASSVWLFNSFIPASALALVELFTHSFEVKFIPTGGQKSSQIEKRSSKELLPYLTLPFLAAFTSNALLGSMALAALATVMNSSKFKYVMNFVATVLLVVGLLQLSAYPIYILMLLPLGTFRY